MKLTLVFVCFIIALNGFSQDKRFNVKFSPFSLIDEFSFPTIQGGIETGLSKRISWYNEVGLKYKKGYFERPDTSFLPSKGFKVKTELRYYPERPLKTKSLKNFKENYWAVNFFYTRNLYNTWASYYPSNGSSIMKVDDFGVRRVVIGSNLLMGGQMAIGKKFKTDFYGGIGVRLREVFTTNKEVDYSKDHLLTGIDYNVSGAITRVDAEGGNKLILGLTLGIRICYKL